MIVFTITRQNGDVETLKTSRTKLTVGGAYTDDITLLGGDISPEHGMFHITGEEVVYTDSGFGTLVNDREIVGETTPLAPDDAVRIDEFVITHVLEQDEVPPTVDEPPSPPPLFFVRPLFRKPEPAPHVSRIFSSIRTGPSHTLSAPGKKSSRRFSIPTPAPPYTLSPPGPTLARFLSRYKSTTQSGKQVTDYKTLANDLGPVIYVVFLMIFLWPYGFLMNFINWWGLKKIGRNLEERPLDFEFFFYGKLLVVNVSILVLILLIIGIKIAAKHMR